MYNKFRTNLNIMDSSEKTEDGRPGYSLGGVYLCHPIAAGQGFVNSKSSHVSLL